MIPIVRIRRFATTLCPGRQNVNGFVRRLFCKSAARNPKRILIKKTKPIPVENR
jgi:hypothetical protein